MFKLNGKIIRIDQDLTIGEGEDAITVPAGSLALASVRAEHGIVEVPDEPRPNERYYFVADNGDGTFTATPKGTEAVVAMKKGDIAAARYQLEIGGLILPNGAKINTERDSQAMVSGALLRVMRAPAALIDWKQSDGSWTKIDKPTVEAVADAVSAHVQACFSAERAKCEALDALAADKKTKYADLIAFEVEVVL